MKILAPMSFIYSNPCACNKLRSWPENYGGAGSTAKHWVSSPQVDTMCLSGTEKGALCPQWAKNSPSLLEPSCRQPKSRFHEGSVTAWSISRIGDIVSHRVDPPTFRTLQAFASFLEQQRLLASGANQDAQAGPEESCQPFYLFARRPTLCVS